VGHAKKKERLGLGKKRGNGKYLTAPRKTKIWRRGKQKGGGENKKFDVTGLRTAEPQEKNFKGLATHTKGNEGGENLKGKILGGD